MRKSRDAQSRPADPRGSDPAAPDRRRAVPTGSGGVSIASGAHIVRIDLEALLRGGDRVAAAGMTGGVRATTTREVAPARAPSRTVALADGTRITFTAADGVHSLESA